MIRGRSRGMPAWRLALIMVRTVRNILFYPVLPNITAMVVLCIGFEVHQPRRLNKSFRVQAPDPRDIAEAEGSYFDLRLDKEIFERVYEKCYKPTTNMLAEAIERTKGSERPFKICYSFSGLFLEQLLLNHPELIETIRSMAKTGNVELLCQTYYHSLASIYYDDMSEFRDQVKEHKKAIRRTFGFEPRIFENTEFIYNNLIAKEIQALGFSGIITEGSDRLLHGSSPHFVYRPIVAKSLRVLTRDYRLSDDIGFRFSSLSLTAEKFIDWVASVAEPLVLIFVDYETFGEHVWPEAGIRDFLKQLPHEIERCRNVVPETASEIVGTIPPAGDVDVYEHGKTISWADERRDLSAWLGNEMQRSTFGSVISLSRPARTIGGEFLRIWRLLQTSDNYHYMYTGTGGPADVHSYFSGPVGSPLDVYVAFSNILVSFQGMISNEMIKPKTLERKLLKGWSEEKAFSFFLDVGKPLNLKASGYLEFHNVAKRVSEDSIAFHLYNGDFEKWFSDVFGDELLSRQIHELRTKKIGGIRLKKAIVTLVAKRIDEIRNTLGRAS